MKSFIDNPNLGDIDQGPQVGNIISPCVQAVTNTKKKLNVPLSKKNLQNDCPYCDENIGGCFHNPYHTEM